MSRQFAIDRTEALRGFVSFLFQRRFAIANGSAFKKILAQKRHDAAEPLVLRGVHEFVNDQPAIAPAVRTNKDAVLQREPRRRGREKIDRRLRES